jgi:hypothetical protein
MCSFFQTVSLVLLHRAPTDGTVLSVLAEQWIESFLFQTESGIHGKPGVKGEGLRLHIQ